MIYVTFYNRCKVKVKKEMEEAVQKAHAFKQSLGSRVLQVNISTSSEEAPDPRASSFKPRPAGSVSLVVPAAHEDEMDVHTDGLQEELERMMDEPED